MRVGSEPWWLVDFPSAHLEGVVWVSLCLRPQAGSACGRTRLPSSRRVFLSV